MASPQQVMSVISMTPELQESDSLAPQDAGAVTVAQLRARIEQQCSLISMLKQRNDETFRELSQCKSLCESTTSRNRELQESLSKTSRSKSVLEQRFHTLSSNHEELTKIMEEYKRENGKLRAEIEHMKRECVASELETKEKKIVVLSETVMERDGRVRVLEGRCSVLEEELREMQAAEREREAVFTSKSKKQQEQQKVVEQKFTEAEARVKGIEGEMIKLRERNKHLQQSLNQKDASINEKSLENNKLQLEIKKLHSEKMALHQDLEKLSVELSSDVQVAKLKTILREEKRKREKLQSEYLAYQKHSSEMLRKEQELNTKLRHLSDM